MARKEEKPIVVDGTRFGCPPDHERREFIIFGQKIRICDYCLVEGFSDLMRHIARDRPSIKAFIIITDKDDPKNALTGLIETAIRTMQDKKMQTWILGELFKLIMQAPKKD